MSHGFAPHVSITYSDIFIIISPYIFKTDENKDHLGSVKSKKPEPWKLFGSIPASPTQQLTTSEGGKNNLNLLDLENLKNVAFENV